MPFPTPESAQAVAGIDLSQFHAAFFEEAAENLDRLEQSLVGLGADGADDETLNAVFRCAHSIKGGAATFGFRDVALLTHEMETLLDRLRHRQIAPTRERVDVLLLVGDTLRAQLARHQGTGGGVVDTDALRDRLSCLTGSDTVAPATAPSLAVGRDVPTCNTALPALRCLELRVGPLPRIADADGLAQLFDEIPGLGTIEPLDAGAAINGCRYFLVTTTSSDAELTDLFTFHVAREHLALSPLRPDHDPRRAATSGPAQARVGAPSSSPAASRGGAAEPCKGHFRRATDGQAAPVELSTLRVPAHKVDQLINLVGQLVATQAMLAERSAGLDPALHRQLTTGLADLGRTARDLQQSVMSMRMIPVSGIFNRFPRMLRDLAAQLGKEVELVTRGEVIELDKALVEKVTDPLTHLVRNAIDHGIEPPAERVARGKSAQGTLTLGASHQGGSVVIEVHDDGRGLSRDRLLAKARARGVDVPDAMSDVEVWQLIFAPGFSTTEAVTEVSGRGVGMDVVRRDIAALGGSVEIDAVEGRGMRVSLRLPLTAVYPPRPQAF